jgi:hypothetical protein
MRCVAHVYLGPRDAKKQNGRSPVNSCENDEENNKDVSPDSLTREHQTIQ